MTRRSKVFLGLLFCGTMLGGVAQAQEQPLAAAPPDKIPLDGHGVNINDGSYTTAQPLVSIGPVGGGGLSASRAFLDSGYRDSYIGTINSPDTVTYTVSVGASTEIFTRSGTTYTNALGGNSTLTYNSSTLKYTYTLGDGTVLTFAPATPTSYQTGPWQENAGRLNTVAFPDGEIDTYNYFAYQFCSGTQAVNGGGTTPTTGTGTTTSGPGTGTDGAGTGGGGATGQGTNPQSCDYVTRLISITSNTGYEIALQYSDGGPGAPPGINHFSVSELDGSNTASSSGTVVTTTIGESGTGVATNDGLVSRQYTFTPLGQISTIQIGTSPATTINLTYDGSGRVATYNDNYYTYHYAYSDSGTTRTTTVTGPTGNKVYVSDTGTHLVASYTDELSRTTNFGYDTSLRLQKVTKPEGDYTTYGYDGRGNVNTVTAVAKAGSGVANIVTQASYDATCTILVKCNKPNYTLDAKGFETDYTYDPTHGGVTSVTLPAPTGAAPTGSGVRPQTRYSYTALTAPSGGGSIYRLTGTSSCATTSSCSGTSDEVKSTIGYDANLLPATTTSGSGDGVTSATNTIVWDSAGNLYTVDGPLAGTADTTRYRYGSAHQLLGVVSPDPDGAGPLAYRAVRYTYDARGLLTSTEKGTVPSQADADWPSFSSLLQQTSTYDTASMKITDALVQGGATLTLVQYGYNTRMLPQCTAIRDPAYAGSLPASACTVTASTAPGADQITQTAYDAAGQPTQTIEGVGTSDATTTSASTYGGDGERLTALDANNNLTTFVYDGVNRLSQIEFPMVGSPQPPASGTGTSQTTSAGIESYTYDANSNRLTLTRRGGNALTYGYDNLNRLTGSSETVTSGYANFTYGYDNLSRLTATTSSQGFNHSFTYDALNRKTSEVTPFGTVASQYDAAGRRTRLTWPDGFYVVYTYDVVGEMTAVEENGATSGPGLLATLAYDNLGRRTTLTRGDGVVTSYGYDTASRLSSVAHSLPTSSQNQTETYGYSVANQVITKTSSNDGWAWNGAYNVNRNYTANGLNEQITSGANTLTWAAKGDLTGDGTLTYSYDTNNYLFAASNGSSQMYDGGGRLYSVGASAATRFAYDGDLAIAEYNSSGGVLRRFVPGPGQDEPLVWYEGSGTTTRYGLTADRLGSITGVVTDAGATAAINSYDEYGLPGTGNTGRYQYTGQKYLSEFGMYDYKARNYAPTLGRFVQPDPIGYSDGLNIYQYVHSDPFNRRDPRGLDDFDAGDQGFIQDDNYLITDVTAYDSFGSNFNTTTLTVTGLKLPNPLSAIGIPGLSSGGGGGFGGGSRALQNLARVEADNGPTPPMSQSQNSRVTDCKIGVSIAERFDTASKVFGVGALGLAGAGAVVEGGSLGVGTPVAGALEVGAGVSEVASLGTGAFSAVLRSGSTRNFASAISFAVPQLILNGSGLAGLAAGAELAAKAIGVGYDFTLGTQAPQSECH